MNKAKEAKLMNFVDGPSVIKIGQEVVYGNGQSGRHYHVTSALVEKIGNKLVTLDNGDCFYLENGHKKSEYVSGGLFSSAAAHDKYTSENKQINKVLVHLRGLSNCSYENALKIAELLNIDLSEKP